MFQSIEFEAPRPSGARIKVIGVGGCGGNAVNNLIEANLPHIEFIAVNTDAQALGGNFAPFKVQLGIELTDGLGAGGDPKIGQGAALEDEERLREHLADTDMVFITAGMGGGTGTGAAPVIARAARAAGALTVAVVTRPFGFEGRQRGRQAEEGLRELAAAVDTLIVIPNDRIFKIANPRIPIKEAFRLVDSVVVEAVRGISDMITVEGLVNVDFADVKSIMKGKGLALMGTGRAAGDNRAVEAAQKAISSPLLEDADIAGATGILVTITGNSDMSLADMNEAMNTIQDAAASDTNTIFGAVIDESMGDEIKVTVVATGFDRAVAQQAKEVPQTRLYAPGRASSANNERQTGQTIPPPPLGRAQTQPIHEETHVYAMAASAPHERVLMAQAVTAPLGAVVHPAQMQQALPLSHGHGPSHGSSHGHHLPPAPLLPPSILPHHEHEIDQPTFLRKNTPNYAIPQVVGLAARREPVQGNPFAPSEQSLEFPAFRRQK